MSERSEHRSEYNAGELFAGRWRLTHYIQRSTFAEIWEAEDTLQADIPKILKILSRYDNTNNEIDERRWNKYVRYFVEREIDTLKKLTEARVRHVVPYDTHIVDPLSSTYVLVMDVIDGARDLAQEDHLLKFGTQIRLDILKRIAFTIDKIHQLGYVHRDIKPGNIIANNDGTPYLIDFGTARDEDPKLTTVRSETENYIQIGTPHYMPAGYYADASSTGELPTILDLYAFAITAFEILFDGQSPFSKDAGDKRNFDFDKGEKGRTWLISPSKLVDRKYELAEDELTYPQELDKIFGRVFYEWHYSTRDPRTITKYHNATEFITAIAAVMPIKEADNTFTGKFRLALTSALGGTRNTNNQVDSRSGGASPRVPPSRITGNKDRQRRNTGGGLLWLIPVLLLLGGLAFAAFTFAGNGGDDEDSTDGNVAISNPTATPTRLLNLTEMASTNAASTFAGDDEIGDSPTVALTATIETPVSIPTTQEPVTPTTEVTIIPTTEVPAVPTTVEPPSATPITPTVTPITPSATPITPTTAVPVVPTTEAPMIPTTEAPVVVAQADTETPTLTLPPVLPTDTPTSTPSETVPTIIIPTDPPEITDTPTAEPFTETPTHTPTFTFTATATSTATPTSTFTSQPTFTPTQTVTQAVFRAPTTTPAFAAGNCNNIAVTSRVAPGELASVDLLRNRDSLNLRAQPSTNSDRIAQMDNGDYVTVLSGPYCFQNYRWWRVTYLGDEGFAVEAIGSSRVMIPTTANSLPILQPGTYEENASGIYLGGTWQTYDGENAAGGQFAVNFSGGSATFRFNGTHVTIVGNHNQNRDVVEICLDGICEVYDVNSQTFLNQQEITLTALNDGIHTVTINRIGDEAIDLDRVVVHNAPLLTPGQYQQGDPAIIYGGRWNFVQDEIYSNGGIRLSTDLNATYSFRFAGSSLTLLTNRSPSHGDIEVCIDGACATYALFESRFMSQQPIFITGLTPGQHVVEVKNSGGRDIDLDAIIIE